MVDLPKRGQLEEYHPVMLLGGLHRTQATGILHIVWASMEKIFWVCEGFIRGATSSLEGEHLLDFLLPHHPDLTTEYERLREHSYPMVLEALLKREIPPDELKRAAGEALFLNVASLMNWFSGEFIWDEHGSLILPIELGMSIPRVLWRVLTGLKDLEFTFRFIGGLHRIPVPAADLENQIENMPFSPQEFFFFTQLDGVHTIEQINSITQLERPRLLALVFLADACGWINWQERASTVSGPAAEAAPPPQSEKPSSVSPPPYPGRSSIPFLERVQNFYQRLDDLDDMAIFNVTEHANWDEIEASYQELMETYRLEKLPSNAEAIHRAMVESIREKVTGAYERLRSKWQERETRELEEEQAEVENMGTESIAYWHLRGPGRSGKAPRRRLKQDLTPQRSFEILMNRALEHIQFGRNYDAVQCLEGASQLKPNHPEPYFLLGTLYETHPRLQRKALDCYEKAIERDPGNELYISHLVNLLIKGKLYRRALRYLEKLVELDPVNEEYKKMLNRLKRELKKLS